MITPRSFTKSWIEGIRTKQKTGKINPPVFEKMIFAFALLEKLAENGLDFIFKGGTSLVLLLSDFRRFSTDIDIITLQTEEELGAVLEKIVQSEKAVAGKVAFFTSLMRTEKFEKFGLYPTTDLPDQTEIVNTNYNFLNRLKKINREAFYYWFQALELLNLSE